MKDPDKADHTNSSARTTDAIFAVFRAIRSGTHFHIPCPALQPFPYSRAALRYIFIVRDGGGSSDTLVSCLSVPTPFPLLFGVASRESLATLAGLPADPAGGFASFSLV